MTETPTSREHRLAETFVALTDTLESGFDVADLSHDLTGACVELLGVSAAGLMLADADGRLRVMASSGARSGLSELMEAQNDQGPCLDSYRSSTGLTVGDLAADAERWPAFAREALRVGFGATYALPMRLRTETIGALNLFHEEPNRVNETTLRLAQALADVATIALLQERAVHSGTELSRQLQSALDTRVVIEQAKGLLAGRCDIEVGEAFEVMRGHARRTRQRLSDVADAVLTGRLQARELLTHRS